MQSKPTAQKRIRNLALSGLFIGIGVVSSMLPLFTFPIGPSRCAPAQHLINILAAVFQGPIYAVMNAFVTSLLRNILGTGSLLAFPGSMIGALLAGVLYRWLHKNILAAVGEFIGTGVLGSLAAWPVAAFLIGKAPATVTFFVLPFMISSGAGCLIAMGLLPVLRRHIP